MKLGVHTPILYHLNLNDALSYLHGLGVQMVEPGSGGYPGTTHCDPEILLNSEVKLQTFKDSFSRHHIEISALSCHGNPVHPEKEKAHYFNEAITNSILLAEKMGIHQINTFSGCPGDNEDGKYPNWVTGAWLEDSYKILDYQWNEILIPYWRTTVEFAKIHGVNKIALEPHPGFCVYNTSTLLRLREAVGEEIGVNFDPSHLIWQGMDPVAVIRKLGKAIFHVHAKDTKIDTYNTSINGVLENTNYGDQQNRSWVFRSVGYGLDYSKWKEIISALRLVGYDYVISIEHEDSLMTPTEGLEKSVHFLKEVMMFENKDDAWKTQLEKSSVI